MYLDDIYFVGVDRDLNHLGALLAGKKRRSSELWSKTYYRNSFYIGLPFSIFLIIIIGTSGDPADPTLCYTYIIVIIAAWVAVFYATWRKVYR
jgi:hypothetical protein